MVIITRETYLSVNVLNLKSSKTSFILHHLQK